LSSSRSVVIIRVPYHVSGFWIPIYAKSVEESGSLGAGLILSRRLEALAGAGLPPNDSVSLRVATLSGLREPMGMELREPYPLGRGFGASAARALAQALAIEVARGRGSMLRAGRLAHEAEVLEGTGLGDVIAEFYGGALVVRLRPGPPGRGLVDRYPVSRKMRVVALTLGSMTTREMHRLYLERISRCGPEAYRSFLKNPGLETFVEEANRFSLCVGFASQEVRERVEAAIRRWLAQGAALGFFVKKKLLVVVLEEGIAYEVAEALRKEFKSSVWIDSIGAPGAEVELP